MHRLRLSLFGPPQIWLNDQPLNLSTRKPVALLAYLAVTGQTMGRDTLATLLWPDLDQTRARASLRQALWTLGDSNLADWLEAQPETIQLKPGYSLDITDFRNWLAKASAHQHAADETCDECLNWLNHAIDLYQGDFLSGFTLRDSPDFDDWQFFQADELRQEYASALERLAILHSLAGELEPAIKAARKWVTLDTLYEPAHHLLLRLYALTGKRRLVIKQYETLREVLDRELGVEPGAESQTLYKNILAGRIAPARTPVEVSFQKATSPHNLPAPLTSLVGRQEEIRQIKQILQPNGEDGKRTRLLTLTGPGGAGKTRLALQVAAELVDVFPGGIWLVDLVGLTEPSHVQQKAALVLGVREQPDMDLSKLLIQALQLKPPLLLILDECEHLLTACAQLCVTLLQGCPDLFVLTTSRQSLRVSGELVWQVAGLSLPVDQTLSAQALVEQSEAARLFRERGLLVQPNFQLTEKNTRAVEQICRQLDGLPLAIELAAARMNVLSPEEIANRLSDRFRLLAARNLDLTKHHQTMQAAVDWSYDLLGQDEQKLFNRLSIFQGSFTLEAAERVCGETANDSFELQESNILDLLSSLIEKSMVVTDPGAGFGFRYRLLETLRQYGRERLTRSGEDDLIRERHAAHFLNFAERAEPGLRGNERSTWAARVEAAHDDLRAALAWTFDDAARDQDPYAGEQAARLAQALWWYWYVQGYWSEGRNWYSKTLDLPLDTFREIVQVRAWVYASLFASTSGNQPGPLELADTGLSLARQFNNNEGIAIALLRKGRLIGRQDPDMGTTLLEESLAIFRRMKDPFYISIAHYYLSYHHGWVFMNSGDFGTASQWLQACLERAEELGADLGKVEIYTTLGQIARLQGESERAAELFEQGLSLCQQFEEDYQVSATRAGVLYAWGLLALDQGNLNQALTYQKEALEIQQRWGMFTEMSMALDAVGAICRANNQAEKAAHLLGAAEAYRRSKGYRLPAQNQVEFDRWLAQVRAACDESVFASAWEIGQAMILEQACRHALDMELR